MIPSSYQFPEEICVKIAYNGFEHKTKNFRKTKWGQKIPIKINKKELGFMKVFSFKDRKFLKEEKAMLKEIVSQIVQITERKKTEEK